MYMWRQNTQRSHVVVSGWRWARYDERYERLQRGDCAEQHAERRTSGKAPITVVEACYGVMVRCVPNGTSWSTSHHRYLYQYR